MTQKNKRVWAEIWCKPEYTESGIQSLVRIIYNPYGCKAKEIIADWIAEEYRHQCYIVHVSNQGIRITHNK